MKGRGVMPKEKINHPRTGVLLEGSVACSNEADPSKGTPAQVGEVVNLDDASVQVGWLKDMWVQVSIEADKSYFKFAAEHPDGETSDRSTIYTPPLTREDLNKLIRVLRRAREQVFGRDE